MSKGMWWLRRAICGVAFAASTAVLAPLWVQADAPAAPVSVPAAPADELVSLAIEGRFDRLLTALQSDARLSKDPSYAGLVRDVQALQEHRTVQEEARRKAHDKSVEEMVEKTASGKLEESLAKAVEAHGLALDGDAFLRDPRVIALVQQTEARATAAERAEDWVEALSLYRALEFLYDDHARYTSPIRRCERHVRLLRLYARPELERLFKARAQRMEKEEKPLQLGEETWEDQLKGVESRTYLEALEKAAQRHIDRPGYQPLLLGALDAVTVLADTQALSKTFPSMAEPAKLRAFEDALAVIRRHVEQKGQAFNFLDASRVVSQILEANRTSLALPEAVLVYEMADGSLSMLDEFSALIWPHELEQFNRNVKGEFFGVGIQISGREGQILVVSPLPGTPAAQAGVLSGDVIAEVDGKPTTGWTLDQAVRQITGPEGTAVRVGIQRKGQAELIQLTLKRARIKIDSIRGWQYSEDGSWDYLISAQPRIGYIRLTQFVPQTADDLDNAIADLQKGGELAGLIIDLRFNPGGLLDQAIKVTDRFVEEGTIVSTVGADGEKTFEARAQRSRTYPQFPIVVLVNRGSASASEIVSGALQDFSRATIIGTRSFGKGSVQDLFRVQRGQSYLKLTTQYYMLPNGGIIHRKPNAKVWGINPDLVVEMTDKQVADSLEMRQNLDVPPAAHGKPDPEKPVPVAQQILSDGLDPQLEAGLIVLKTRLLTDRVATK